MDNTIIFYYGDHGGVLPRSKGYIYETGIHVPMVVYAPPRWQHLMPLPPGSRTDGFVRFIDLAPTVLHLAGVEVPPQMDGQPFLGLGVTAQNLRDRNAVFSYADRFDEKYDLVRAVRVGKYKYIRNYQPFNVDALYNFYRYKMLIYREWKELFLDGQLNEQQRQFFLPRSAEALYDLEEDPFELNNLADQPAYADTLLALRHRLQHQVKSMPDLSFYPEPVFLQEGLYDPVHWGQAQKGEIAQLVDIADLMLAPFDQVKKPLHRALRSDRPWHRYWALIVCSAFGAEAAALYETARRLLAQDPSGLVRMRAAEFLGLTRQQDPSLDLLKILARSETAAEANLVLNTIALLMEVRPEYRVKVGPKYIQPQWMENPRDLVARRYQYLTGQTTHGSDQ